MAKIRREDIEKKDIEINIPGSSGGGSAASPASRNLNRTPNQPAGSSANGGIGQDSSKSKPSTQNQDQAQDQDKDTEKKDDKNKDQDKKEDKDKDKDQDKDKDKKDDKDKKQEKDKDKQDTDKDKQNQKQPDKNKKIDKQDLDKKGQPDKPGSGKPGQPGAQTPKAPTGKMPPGGGTAGAGTGAGATGTGAGTGAAATGAGTGAAATGAGAATAAGGAGAATAAGGTAAAAGTTAAAAGGTAAAAGGATVGLPVILIIILVIIVIIFIILIVVVLFLSIGGMGTSYERKPENIGDQANAVEQTYDIPDGAKSLDNPSAWHMNQFEIFDNQGNREKGGCHITSIAMVLKFFGKDVNPQKIYEEHGYSNMGNPSGMASKYGLEFTENTPCESNFNNDLKFIQEGLNAGIPVIIGAGPDIAAGNTHFLVITGINTEKQELYTNDPAESHPIISFDLLRNSPFPPDNTCENSSYYAYTLNIPTK